MPLPFRIRTLVLLLSSVAATSQAWSQGAAAGLAATSAADAAALQQVQQVQQLQATTMALIDALVEQGLLSRARADALVRAATAKAAPAAMSGAAAPAAAGATAPGWGAPVAAGAGAGAARPVQRVTYLSETARSELREAIKLDVLEQARTEGWADARQIPGWVRAIRLGGDLRVRSQSDRYDPANLPAEEYQLQNLLASTPAWAPDMTNTTHDRSRLTLRARLGVDVKISEDTSAGLRLSTGNTSGPTSSSQTLGNSFNKLSLVLDRAWIRWEPRHDLRLTAGRMAQPFFGTDLLWPDDLSLDGVAVAGDLTLASGLYLFATGGAFAIEELALSSRDKWLYGLQVGADWTISPSAQLRVGLAVYDFQQVEGVRANDPRPSGAAALTTPYQGSEYPRNLRQKGNTLINLNDATSTASPVWGLASKFRPINLTAAMLIKSFDPTQLTLSLDWVKNSAFNLDDIFQRAGDPRVRDVLAKTTGLQARVQVGDAQLSERGRWQGFAALRKFERDAWIDGLTDTTWHTGGTNYQGWSLGGQYAFDRNTSLGLRWTSTRNLDDAVLNVTFPQGTLSGAPLKIDVLQVELSTRF